MTTSDKIIDRVRKILAHAEHPGTPPDEAALFAARAADLMTRHALDEATVRAQHGQAPEPVTRWDMLVSGRGGHGRARVMMLGAVVGAYGCEYARRWDDASNDDRYLLIVGTDSALAALRLLLPSLVLQAETAARPAARQYVRDIAGALISSSSLPRLRRDFYRSFLVGYGKGVAEKITAGREQITREVAGTGAELVLVGDAKRVAAEFARQFPKLRKGRTAQLRSASAYHQGRTAGQRADLGTGHLGGTDRPALPDGH